MTMRIAPPSAPWSRVVAVKDVEHVEDAPGAVDTRLQSRLATSLPL
ncbi:hypothetical protein ACIRSU_12675 [Streptomyces sp. NPDC101160]